MRHHAHQRARGDELFAARLEEDWGTTHIPGARRRRLPRRSTVGASEDHKAMQLCRQVAVTLNEVFAECGDPLLQGLRVLSVEPAPDLSRLRVMLAADGGLAADPPLLESHLTRASGHLRGEVAQAITRKRAPSLAFFIAPVETGA